MKKNCGRNLGLVSFPLGGIGAGMICIEGTGSFGSLSIRHAPELDFEPGIFSAITILGDKNISRVVEAPVPDHKVFIKDKDSGNGLGNRNYGLPRFSCGEFSSRFPFATINLTDSKLPLTASIAAWSPFIPNDEDRSSLPFAAIEYTFHNTSNEKVDAVYYFCTPNFMKKNENSRVRSIKNGLVLEQDGSSEEPHNEGSFCISVDEDAYIDTAWFRGGWFDTRTILWNNIADGLYGNKFYKDPEKGASPGGTIAIPFTLTQGSSKTIRLKFSWYVPLSSLRRGKDIECSCNNSCNCAQDSKTSDYHMPWYTNVINGIEQGNDLWSREYNYLYNETRKFTECFYDTTLPDEIIDAVSANLSIIKSPTILRQADGRLWGWEGCCDSVGCCEGTCTHVWNYAQALCNLFPRLERGIRQYEFFEMQDEQTGHQNFRAALPIRKTTHDFHAASDGQLGGIIKVYRDWKISGDTGWLRSIWDKIRQSLDFCINQWDPDKEGVLKEPHHNTYDIEFWGPDGMCSSFYLGALKAAYEMGKALGEDCSEYLELYNKGREYLEKELFNGEYFYQKVIYEGLRDKFSYADANSETRILLEKEGPKYQYGTGCLSDGILGVWLSEISGSSDILDDTKVRSHLKSVYKYNFRTDLSDHANPQRPGYAIGNESGLLLCTWPKGGKPSLPFVYSDEVWTGIEYQVASHLLMKGYTKEGLDIVRACRNRYDGIKRNPYNEYECGHWYARAMASYALMQGYTGVRYDALTKTLYAAKNNANSYKTFLSTATGYGNVVMDNGKITVKVISGKIDIERYVVV
jgi:uncharacterized protein (DUF608 family)